MRDTRERCERGLLGAIRNPDEETGAPGEICRYNQLDATRGDFFNVDYAVALRSEPSSLTCGPPNPSERLPNSTSGSVPLLVIW